MAPATKRIAYSYARISTGQQLEGRGLERQADMAADWCKRNGYKLDGALDLTDRGRSAYKGRHISHGALGRFLELAKQSALGASPVLLIEAIDRLSRQEPMAALQGVAFALIDAGVVIVDLEDQRTYDRESLQGDALIMLVLKARAAHEYSKRLARRVGSSWNQLREDFRQGTAIGRGPAGGRHPFWLTLNQATRCWEFNDRAEDVGLIFDQLQYQGLTLVAQELNARGSLSPGGKPWAHYSVRKVALDPAVAGSLRLGEYAHAEARAALSRWKRAKAEAEILGTGFSEPEPVIPVIELIPGHYPAVVSQEVFDRVGAALDRRAKGKGAGGNRNTNRVAVRTFLQSGLARCQHGGTMGATLSRKPGRDDIYYLRCRSRGGGRGCRCNGKGWRIEDAHAHVITRLSRHLLGEAVLPGNDHTAELQGLTTRLEAAQKLANEATEQLDRAAAALANAVDQGAQIDLLENLSHLVEQRRGADRKAAAQAAHIEDDIRSLKARARPADELNADGIRLLLQALANGADTQAERARLHQALVRARLEVVLDDSNQDRMRVGMRFGDEAPWSWKPLAAQASRLALRLGAVEPEVVYESAEGDHVCLGERPSSEALELLGEDRGWVEKALKEVR